MLRRFPTATCRLCGDASRDDRELCEPCAQDLPRNLACCRCCALPIPVPGLCGECTRRLPAFDAAYVPFTYDPPFTAWIPALKFHGSLAVGRLLGQLLRQELAHGDRQPPDAIIPVPLHASRLRQRGFNQAIEIARAVDPRLVRHDIAHRRRNTPPQTHLDATARRRNLRQAFSYDGPIFERVALLDDVVTTGATVGELARAIKAAGVQWVEVWAVARAQTASTRPVGTGDVPVL